MASRRVSGGIPACSGGSEGRLGGLGWLGGAARRARAWLGGSAGARVGLGWFGPRETVIWSSRGHSSVVREDGEDDAIPIERGPDSGSILNHGICAPRESSGSDPVTNARLGIRCHIPSTRGRPSGRTGRRQTRGTRGDADPRLRGRGHICSTREPLPGRGFRPREQRLEHWRGEAAGERVLLARVIRPEQDVRPDDRLRAVPEPWPRPDGVAVRPEDAQDGVPPEGAEGDDDSNPWQERQLPLEEWETSVALFDRRSVRGWRTADRRGDVDPAEGEAVVRPAR